LFLTDLKGYDVVFGKMLATSLNSIYVLFAILPPMAIPLLLGGVTGGEFWRLVLVLIITFALSLAVGLFVSALSRDSQRAWAMAYLLIIFFAVLAAPAALAPLFNALSPTVAFLQLSDLNYRLNSEEYWLSVTGTSVLTIGLFTLASVALPRVWQERVVPMPRWLRRVFAPAYRVSKARSQARLRQLTRNPVTWAAERSSSRPIYVWTVTAGVCVGGIIAMIVRPGSAAVSVGLVIAGGLIYLLMSVWVATEACHLFPAARQSGALELLLCTPITVKEIIDGHFQALQRLFTGPVLLIITTLFILVASYIYSRGQAVGPVEAFLLFMAAGVIAILLVLDLHAIGRYGMWMGLKSRKPGVAVTKTVAFVLVLPLLAVFPCIPGAFILPIGWIVKDLIFINYARDQIARQFRKAATQAAGLQASKLAPPRLPPVLP
jgi:hypothetical protein